MVEPYWLIALLVGVLAGAAELMSRYRDEPTLAVTNRAGFGYILLNGLLGLAAHGFFGFDADGAPQLADNQVLNALAAGSGAMLVLRSKLFTLRLDEDRQYSFGPAIIMESFLAVLDRKIDRMRAARRHDLVSTNLSGVDDFDGTAAYFEMSLLSFQNLSQQEKAELVGIIKEYREAENWSPELRTMAVGFAVLTIAGEDNFARFVSGLKTHLGIERPS